ncbi:cyclic AMP response element-binding protein A isoform X2 [Anthonomus grandis grandis]|uniref:cyclic AMP response element-binding protein A isoform X2 n=1 Tax=Anthonomus grandis grandis TaxID=2921223 RepID=UPI00216629D1|nr:cyclic AMP response element-binding protein A isoform X2 [Anthonomus grandis grandis]
MEMPDVLRLHSGENGDEWSFIEAKDIPGIILHDRLMTDAALGTRPIKAEHSYSLSTDIDSQPETSKQAHSKVDDMEDECYPAISMNPSSCDRLTDVQMHIKEEITDIKDEYSSETESIHSSCPSSPQPQLVQENEIQFDVSQISQALLQQTGHNIVITTNTLLPQRIQIPKINFKLATSNGSTFHLPPTPPSCSSSDDSEDNATISQPSSPAARKANRPILPNPPVRQPIYTPLISSQPKGSTGILVLTEEEKRTLIAEGYPVPTRLPLTKSEEKSLKKIRRKIKNKISAQESRRKKKEYMDTLERKVEILVNENNDFKKTIETLQESNSDLLQKLQKLQAIVTRMQTQK